MKIFVTVAMSNTNSAAENFLTAQLPQVLDNAVKIWMFDPSKNLRQEWTDEIADKHLEPIRTCINNTVTKRGKLSEETVLKVWNQSTTLDRVQGCFRRNSRDKKYSLLKSLFKIDSPELGDFHKRINDYGSDFVKKILIDELIQDDVIAQDIQNIANVH